MATTDLKRRNIASINAENEKITELNGFSQFDGRVAQNIRVDLGRFAVGDVNETGDIPPQASKSKAKGSLAFSGRAMPIKCWEKSAYICQGLPVGQRGEGHGEELVQTGEVFDFVFSMVIDHTAAKRVQEQRVHELRKHELALVHGALGANPRKPPSLTFDVQIETKLRH